MAKIELKGKVIAVDRPEPVGANGFMKQNVYFNVPGYVDQFGDKKGEDELWQLQVLGEKIKTFNLDENWEGKNAICGVYINSRCIPKTDTKPEMFFIQAVIADIKLHSKTPA